MRIRVCLLTLHLLERGKALNRMKKGVKMDFIPPELSGCLRGGEVLQLKSVEYLS
jgi:hypothetical protein